MTQRYKILFINQLQNTYFLSDEVRKVRELPLKQHHYGIFPTEGVRNWIVKRAYELGFDVNLHGDYDRFAKDWTFRNSDNRIDRIGKKYQWIAFHEIMGILADNYKYEDDYANEGSGRYELFHGTWQSFLRNINPSMIARVKSIESEDADDSRVEKKTNGIMKNSLITGSTLIHMNHGHP